MKEINQGQWTHEVLASTTPVLVDFWAPWCAPCKRLTPILHELSTEMTEVTFVSVNTDTELALAQRYEIRALPTLALFKDGKLLGHRAGAMPKDKVLAWLKESLG